MGFDASAYLAQQKKQQEERKSSDNRKYPYRCVFLSPGNPDAKILVRVLPNDVSNSVSYAYWIHIGSSSQGRYDCGYNHNIPCPICDAVNQVKNVTGQAPKISATGRSVLLAQYIRSEGYDFGDKGAPNVGDIILLMGPRGMHYALNESIMSAGPDGIVKILTDVNGCLVNFHRDKNNRAVVTPTYEQVISASSQEEYNNMLASLPDLKSIAHGELSDTELTKMKELANQLTKSTTVLNPLAPQQNLSGESLNPAQPQVQQDTVQPQPQVYQPQYQQVPVQQVPVQPQVVQQQVPPISPLGSELNTMAVQPQVQQVPQSVLPESTPIATVQQVPIQPQVQQVPVQQVPVQEVPVMQTVAPVPEVSVPSTDNPQVISAMTLDESGVPNTCPKVFSPSSPSCVICMRSVDCPFK